MSAFVRADLIALTQDGLIQLSNAGLVKRGLRDIESGAVPELALDPDGTVQARFVDQTLTILKPGRSMMDASCTCPASGACRHRVMLVLAYQARHRAEAQESAPEAEAEDWDPADTTEAMLELLTAQSGASVRSELARLTKQSLEVHLAYGKVPSARLPMATVRFLVPADLGYATCDCSLGQKCVHIALAVRAFQQGRSEASGVVRIGPSGGASPDLAAARLAGLACMSRLLLEGVRSGLATHAQQFERARRAAELLGATWLQLALEAMEDQVVAYEERSARYDERVSLGLVTEIAARLRSGARHALGVGEAMETRMAQTRLASLGARITGTSKELRVTVLLADTDMGSVLAASKSFTATTTISNADVLNRQLFTGISTAALAKGQLLTSVATRRADASLSLGAGRGGRTAVLPHAGSLNVPEPLKLTTLASLLAVLGDHAPTVLQGRSQVRNVHVFDVDGIEHQAYAPGAQEWLAVAPLARSAASISSEPELVYLERSHDAGAPDALPVLFAAAAGHYGKVRQIAGPIRFENGRCICTPWSLTADTFVVPDVESAPTARTSPPLMDEPAGDHALDSVEQLLGEVLHLGTGNLPRDFVARGASTSERCQRAGYTEMHLRLSAYLAGMHAPEAGPETFLEAALWLHQLKEDPES